MLNIIKYQLKDRRNSMLLMGGIFLIFNLIAFALETKDGLLGHVQFGPSSAFWVGIAVSVTIISTIVMFYRCSSGHVKSLLFKDTSYLMLTIPRRGWEIIGGRLIAGLIEFLIFGISGALLLSVHAAFGAVFATSGTTSFLQALGIIYQQIFGLNLFSFIQLGLIGLCLFVSLGIFLTFAMVASRSFIKKNRGLATVITIVVFIFVINWAVQLSTSLSQKLNWFAHIPLYFNPSLFSNAHFNGTNLNALNSLAVPMAPVVFFLVLAAVLFAGASWLMEKKVEL